MPGVFLLAPGPVFLDPNKRTVLDNITVTASGSAGPYDGYGYQELQLVVNITGAVSGSITFTIEEVDPNNQTTVLQSKSGAAIVAPGTQVIVLPASHGDTFRVSWAVTGGSPSFTGTKVTLVGKASGAMLGISPAGNLIPLNLDALGNLQVVVTGAPAGADAAIVYGDTVRAAIGTFDVRRTTYTEQTTNFTGSVSSSSAADTAAGTGARTIRITYLDQTGAGPFTETVTLNGTTPVNLVNTNHCYIERVEVLTVGSGGSNAGTISLFRNAAGAVPLIGTIAIGNNRTFWCHHYVPTGKTCKVTGTQVASTSTVVGGGSSFALRAKPLDVATAVERQVTDTLTLYGQSSQTPRLYTTAIPLATGPARIAMYVTTTSSTSLTYRAAFDYYDS